MTESRGMRMFAVAGLLASATACAHMQPPPGGHVDKIPPKVVSLSPEDGAVNVTAREVVFTFDKVVSERPQTGKELNDLVLISPVEGSTNTDWHRHSISIRPDKGWRKNTAYTVRLQAGVTDLWGNARKTDTTITFSTGASIPKTVVRGVLFDWERGVATNSGFVQVFTR